MRPIFPLHLAFLLLVGGGPLALAAPSPAADPNRFAQNLNLTALSPAGLDKVLARADQPRFAQELIRYLARSPDLNALFRGSAQVSEGYSVGEHSIRVLETFTEQKPFFELEFLKLPKGIRARRLMPLLLALHDIGKSRAESAVQQHEWTVPILKRTLGSLGFTTDEVAIAASLVDGDPVGRFLKGAASAEAAETAIRAAARKTALGVPEYFQMLQAYYVSDAGSYPYLKQRVFETTAAGQLQIKNASYAPWADRLLTEEIRTRNARFTVRRYGNPVPTPLYHWTTPEGLQHLAGSAAPGTPFSLPRLEKGYAREWPQLRNQGGLYAWTHPITGSAGGPHEIYGENKTLLKIGFDPRKSRVIRLTTESTDPGLREQAYAQHLPDLDQFDLVLHHNLRGEEGIKEYIVLNTRHATGFTADVAQLRGEVLSELEKVKNPAFQYPLQDVHFPGGANHNGGILTEKGRPPMIQRIEAWAAGSSENLPPLFTRPYSDSIPPLRPSSTGLEALADLNLQRRQAALLAFIQAPPRLTREQTRYLESLTRSHVPSLRGTAWAALFAAGYPEVLEPSIVEQIKDGNLPAEALELLTRRRRFHPEILPALFAILANPEWIPQGHFASEELHAKHFRILKKSVFRYLSDEPQKTMIAKVAAHYVSRGSARMPFFALIQQSRPLSPEEEDRLARAVKRLPLDELKQEAQFLESSAPLYSRLGAFYEEEKKAILRELEGMKESPFPPPKNLEAWRFVSGESEIQKRFIPLLQDPNPEVRYFAAQCVAGIASSGAAVDREVFLALKQSLQERPLGKEALAELKRHFNHSGLRVFEKDGPCASGLQGELELLDP